MQALERRHRIQNPTVNLVNNLLIQLTKTHLLKPFLRHSEKGRFYRSC